MSQDYTIRKLLAYTDYETAESLAVAYEDIETCQEVCNHYTNLFELPNVKRFSEIAHLIQQNLFNANIPTNLQIRFFPKDKICATLKNAALSGNLDFVRHYGGYLSEGEEKDHENYAWLCGHERIFPDIEWDVAKVKYISFSNIDPRLLDRIIAERITTTHGYVDLMNYSMIMLENGKIGELIERVPSDFLGSANIQETLYHALLRMKCDDFLTNPPAILNKIPNWSFDGFKKLVISNTDFPFILCTASQVRFFRKEIEEIKGIEDMKYKGLIIPRLEVLDALSEILGEEKIRGVFVRSSCRAFNVSVSEMDMICEKYLTAKPRNELLLEKILAFGLSMTMTSYGNSDDRSFVALVKKYQKEGGEITERIQSMVKRYNDSMPEECRIKLQ